MKHASHNHGETALRDAMQGLATEIADRHTPPPASTVWLRAQRRARQRALARAALPLRIMSAFGLAAMAVAAAFVLHQCWLTPSLPPTAAHILMVWAMPALALILAGCGYILRVDRETAALSTNP